MNKKQGLLIVFEGIDGSGKTTQIELLKKFLALQGVAWEAISFPQYGKNKYADQIESYLKGNISYDSYSIAKAFAGDRLLAKPRIVSWLKKGKLVIANRYASSSKAHLGANISETEREDFFKWLNELEYKTNDIPKEDLTILLNVDPKISQKNLGEGNDIHERSLKHLTEASKIYLQLAKSNSNWYVVECIKAGKMKPREEIHKRIMEILDEN